MERLARTFCVGMTFCVVGATALFGLYAHEALAANTCNDSGHPSVQIQREDGNEYCYPLPQIAGMRYEDAFLMTYGFSACVPGYALIDDGTCVPDGYNA